MKEILCVALGAVMVLGMSGCMRISNMFGASLSEMETELLACLQEKRFLFGCGFERDESIEGVNPASAN